MELARSPKEDVYPSAAKVATMVEFAWNPRSATVLELDTLEPLA